MILEHDPAAVNDEDNDSQTALHLACIHGKYDVVELLLDKGADIEARDFNLWMPLDCAAAYGRPKCAKMLLEAGASVDPVDKVGGALFMAKRFFPGSEIDRLQYSATQLKVYCGGTFHPVILGTWGKPF